MTKEENELLTRVGAGTPMGELLRRYWMPALLSRELPEPDAPPVRVKLLGEKLVAFRDSSGRVGLVEEFCAHRRASLFLGRNEDGGLRCVYHGWKFDVEGRCIEQPTESQETCFKDTIRLRSCITAEMGGLVWAYLGPKEKIPLPPKFEWTRAPENRRLVTKVWTECNWLQAVDGNFDAFHAAYLHRNLTNKTDRAGLGPDGAYLRSTTAPLEIELTDYGFCYAAMRPLEQGKKFVHINHYVMPFHQMRLVTSKGEFKSSMIEGHMQVPMDDENCMDYVWRYSLGDDSVEAMAKIEEERGRGPEELSANYRKVRNKDNDWLIDRRVQKTETYSGIEGINTQDHAVQESMGPIVDRTQEHLGSSDRAVFALRSLLIQTARAHQRGTDPRGLSASYYNIRPWGGILSADASWKDRLRSEI
jgi:phenylpropionate dioxygenase-like ring-hydroxylating dioxygenase large terminal subunit